MTTHTPDELPGPDAAGDRTDPALERLRAADPAHDDTADVEAIRAAVRDRAPEAFGGAAAAAALPRVPDELAARRDRRRRVPLQVAAAVAGALVVGAGGYALGAEGGSGGGGTVAATTALAPIELGATTQGDVATQEESTAVGSLPEVGAVGPRVTTEMIHPGYGAARTVFRQEGLSEAGGSAEAWAYDAAGVFSSQTARRVADVLGVGGDVREEYGSYVVGERDGTGPTVSLQPDGLASVSFVDPAKDPWGCVVVEPAPDDATSSSGGGSADVAPVEPGACAEADHGVPPSRDAAVAQLRDVMGSLGLDTEAFEYVAEDLTADQAAPRATTVTAYEVVEGQRTGASWSATFSGAGLASLYGSLAPRVPLGTYDVVSPAEAVERLDDPRFSGGGPVALARDALDAQAVPEILPAPEDPVAPTVPPTVPEGSAIAWPVTEVTITSARLGHGVQHQPDGAAVLVPAYELTDADGGTWSVLAVADDRLDFSVPAG
ncbi:hypothetical protein [Cellulosimicrobium sp. NPDC057127]|uniref:hypothetical protein n=1 Tax=Cellulosimicrobium sp. NPDC057127 TaxID=3346026 RepID=UPI00364243C8